MSFKLRVSLTSPIGTKLDDKVYEFDKELQARDMLDLVKTIFNKYSFETYEEYLATTKTIGYILQGYEYAIKPKGRKEIGSITWLKKGKEVKKESDD